MIQFEIRVVFFLSQALELKGVTLYLCVCRVHLCQYWNSVSSVEFTLGVILLWEILILTSTSHQILAV